MRRGREKDMNKKQEKTVELIKTGVMNAFDYSRGAGRYELKKFTVNECEYFVSVIAVVGMVDDEGTMAEYLCRDKVHLFIGKRGGITYPMFKNSHYYTKRFKNFITTSLDQKHC